MRVLSKQTAETASILWREADGAWQTARMKEGASPKIHYHPFADLRADVSYQVRLGSLVPRFTALPCGRRPKLIQLI